MEITNILLTGEIQVGKSTVINTIIDKYFKNKKVTGFKTLAFSKNNEKQGYYIEDQLDKGVKANIENIVGQTLHEEQRCFGIKDTFENKGVEILDTALNSNSDLILIDELGFFERDARNFQRKLVEVLESDIRTIGVLKKKDTQFLNSIKSREDILVIQVTEENRNDIEGKIKQYWKL